MREELKYIFIGGHTAANWYFRNDTVCDVCHWSIDPSLLPQFRGTKADRSQSSNPQ